MRKENIDFICPEFPETGICGTFRRRGARFGFVERYPRDKEAVTGIGYEPWHFRYVGAPHAAIMRDNGLTLEEYHDFLRDFPSGARPYLYREGTRAVEVSYLAAERLADWRAVLENALCAVSGNNADGFVLTVWRSL